MYATTARIFELLASLFAQSLATYLTDAMAELARRGALGVVQVGDLDMHWFATRTLAASFQHPSAEQQHASARATPGHAESSRRRMDAPLTPPGRPSSLPAESWPLLHAAALELLFNTSSFELLGGHGQPSGRVQEVGAQRRTKKSLCNFYGRLGLHRPTRLSATATATADASIMRIVARPWEWPGRRRDSFDWRVIWISPTYDDLQAPTTSCDQLLA